MYPACAKVSIRAMTFSRSTKGLLAAIASASLLLCQTALAAQACALAPEAAAETTASGHCHDGALQSGDEVERIPDHNCPAALISASLIKLDIPQIADFPAIEFEPRWIRDPVRGGLSDLAPLARAESPPLSILHCCLRN